MTEVTIHVNIITGNIVTPKAVLYSGHVVVAGDTVCHVGSGTDRVPEGNALRAIIRRAFSTEKDGPRIRAPQERSPLPILTDTFTISTTRIDAPGLVVPGFVDIHNHGLGGVDEVCDHWTVPEFSQRELARCGTLSTLASVIFSQKRPEATAKVIETIESVVGNPVLRSSSEKPSEVGCVIEGIHAEGPIIQDWGGLPIADSDISVNDFKALCATMPSLRIMTISPTKERQKNFERLRYLVEIGVRPSLGHDRAASEEDIILALQIPKQVTAAKSKQSQPNAGPALVVDRLHSTHIYNVMSFHHRQPSLINFLLCNKYPESGKFTECSGPPTVEIICDLIHVNPIAIQSVLSCRSAEDVALISDCISSYHPGKRLRYNGRQIAVKAEGGCYLCDSQGRPTSTLAGSTVTLADQFFTLVSHFRLDVVTAALLLATTPARIAQLHHVGSIEIGKRANLLLLDGAMGRIEKRMIYGQWVEAPPYVMLRPAMSSI